MSNYEPLGKGIMPILGYVSPPPANTAGKNNESYITDDSYRLIKEAGINIISGLYEHYPANPLEIGNALNCAYNNGIGYLVKDLRLSLPEDQFQESFIDSYKDHPGCIGVLCRDEPNSRLFKALANTYGKLKEFFSKKIFYVNMLPMYATAHFLYGTPNEEGGDVIPSIEHYEEFIREYMRIVKPPFISYDYYPCFNEFPNMEKDYFLQLSIIRKIALENGIPFWTFIQCCSFKHNVTREPGRVDLFWQVNTSLAYGAKGIQYFTLWTPFNMQNDPNEGEYFTGGIISSDGRKNPAHDFVKEINEQIAAVDSVLMECVSKGLMLKGEPLVPIPERDIVKCYGAISKVDSTEAVLIGCFDNKGTDVYYLVNICMHSENQINLQFDRSLSAEITQKACATLKSGSCVQLILEPGEGAMVVIER